jgi:DNA-binding beta-propeller fold protein YncE
MMICTAVNPILSRSFVFLCVIAQGLAPNSGSAAPLQETLVMRNAVGSVDISNVQVSHTRFSDTDHENNTNTSGSFSTKLQIQTRYVDVPGHPFAAVSSPDGRWLFVSVTSSKASEVSGVAVLRRSGNSKASLQRVIPVEPTKADTPLPAGLPTTAGMVITQDGKLLIVTHREFVVFLDVQRAISGDTSPILGFLKIQERAFNVYVNVTRDSGFVFVSNEGTPHNITVIDLNRARTHGFSTEAIVGTVLTGHGPVGTVFSPDERLLYTTSAYAEENWGWPVKCKSEWGGEPKPEGAIVIVDVERAKSDPGNSVVGRVPAGCTPVRLDITPDGSTVWTAVRNSDAVAGYDAAKLLAEPANSRIAWIKVGSAPIGIVITRDGKYVLNTNSSRFRADADSPGTITVIDRERAISGAPAVAGSIEAGIFPRQLALSPDGETIFVTNYLSDTIELIDATHLPE